MRLKAYLISVLAGYCLVRGNRIRARKWFDRYFALEPAPHAMPLAQDAFLKILEDRGSEARSRFLECLENAESDPGGMNDYIAIYCRFWIAVYDPKVSCQQTLKILSNAHDAKESKWFKLNFPLPSSKVVARIKEDPPTAPLSAERWAFPTHNVRVTFSE